MATITQWNPFGVSLNIIATAGTITRTSATQYTVKLNVSWETYWSSNKTDYGMKASSGGNSVTISGEGTKRNSGSSSFTGTYSISGNGSASKKITVTFTNYNTYHSDSATKSISLTVKVPAWTSYKITYNANNGSGVPSTQTKWKDQTLTLSSTKPTRTGYTFQGWSTSSSATSATYSAGGSYTANAAATLYAVWKANTYTVTYNANGGSGAPANQEKTYGVNLTLSSTKPTRTNYNFLGWGTSASATSATYSAGGVYSNNSAVTLYAVWKWAYTKPRITNLRVSRCDENGLENDIGTYVRVRCSWSSDRSIKSISYGCEGVNLVASTSFGAYGGGTSGTVDEIFGSSSTEINIEESYTFYVTIKDSGGSTTKYANVVGQTFTVDKLVGGRGIAFGKPAELNNYMDCKWRALFHSHVYSTSPDCPFIHTHPETGKRIRFGIGSGGTNRGIWVDDYSNWMIYNNGTNTYLGTSYGIYKPYYGPGDKISNFTVYTAGFITSSSKNICFTIPMCKPYHWVGSVSIASNNGLIIRSSTGGYILGSSWDNSTQTYTYAKPSSYSAAISIYGIRVTAVMPSSTDTSDVTNNTPVGITANLSITFNAPT